MSFKLFVCGDIVNKATDANFIGDNLINIIRKSNFSIGNFEAPIEIINMKAINKAGPHLYQSKESIQYLSKVGFNMMSLANNHIYDYGQEALEATLLEFKNNNIDSIGAGVDFNNAYTTKIVEKNGIKMGFVAGCENEFGCLYENQNRAGYAWIFHYLIEDDIRRLKQEVDIVVLIAHAGVEEISFPIKEWRDRYQRLCDVGVDVVVGHHPHVPQGYEKYNDSMIFYSLGNFYFDTAGHENKNNDSYSIVLDFEKKGLKNFEIIYHKKIDTKTCIVKKEEVNFSLKELNNLLGEGYKKRSDDVCVELFNKYYCKYYEQSLGKLSKDATLIHKLEFLFKKIFFRKGDVDSKNLLLLHNIRIDSHRFVVQRALSLISEKEK